MSEYRRFLMGLLLKLLICSFLFVSVSAVAAPARLAKSIKPMAQLPYSILLLPMRSEAVWKQSLYNRSL